MTYDLPFLDLLFIIFLFLIGLFLELAKLFEEKFDFNVYFCFVTKNMNG